MDARLRGLIGLLTLLVGGAGAIAQSVDGQTVADVSVRGNRFITAESILAKTKTRKDRPYSQAELQSDLSTLMSTRQFSRVTPFVQPAAGNQVQIVFEVVEYPNVVQEIRYEGAKHLKDDELNTITGLKRGVPLNPIANKLAVNAILRKLHEQGRLYASVELVEGGNPGDTRVVFRITEGRIVKVGRVSFEGNSFVTGERLRTQIQTSRTLLGLGGDYNPAMIDFDVAHLEEYYRTYGYQDVRVSRELIYDGPDRVHLIFHIAEGPRYRVSQVQFNGGGSAIDPERVKSVTQLKPGDNYDKNVTTADVKNIKTLYGNTGRLVNPKEEVYQTGPGEVAVQYTYQERPPATVGEVIIIGNTVTRDNVIRRQVPLRPGQILTYPDLQVAEANLARLGIFEMDPEKGQRPTVSVIDPDGDNPIKNILVQVTEAPTGSFLLGVGVNSDAGISGSIVLNERNFDITRLPTSFDELLSGQAFRGAGQEFRLEAVPGNRFQRYTASFREPSLFDTQFSLGNSFYFYTRGFSEYNEQRLGGRTVLGRRIADTYWSANVSARLESVDVFDVPFYAPQSILEDAGTTWLAGVRGAAQYDSRDSFLRPSAGMQVEMGYEQVFGTYTYPLFSVEGSRYFTVYQRPDGSGKHVVALRSQSYFTNSEAPVYERFYAGGFRSLRGFSFRGVGPFENGFNVGGQFSFLNSVEYQVPILASDKLFGVVFCDTGTVEPTIAINDYRVAAGFGFRIQVPMFGPVPIALDFGFPIVRGDGDQEQMFNFWLGFFN
jgi:outer membrane protein assembly complex protein YaeT